MKLVEAMYGWNRNSDEIDVGPWPDTTGWSDRYSLTGGACYTNIRQMSQDQLAAQIFIDFHMIVLRDGVEVQAAHRAFLKIDEFRGSIAPDIPGADLEGGAEMSGNTNNSPLIKAAGLWAKSSVKGGQYLTGRLGGVKVLVMENRDRKTDDDPSHILYFTEAPDRRQDVGERPQERSGEAGATSPPRTPQNAPAAQRTGFPGHRTGFPEPGTGIPGHRNRAPDHQAPLDADHDDAPEWAR